MVIVDHSSSFLIAQKKSITKNPKIYAFYYAFFLLDRRNEGLIAKTMVALHLKRLLRTIGSDIFYWNDSLGKEVDIVILSGNTMIPIEVKYTVTISKGDLKVIKQFSK